MLRTIGGIFGICQAPVALNRHPLSSARDELVRSVAISKFKVVEISDEEMQRKIQRIIDRMENIGDEANAITTILMSEFIKAKPEHEDLLKSKLIQFFSEFETNKVIDLKIVSDDDVKIRFFEGGFDRFFEFIKTNKKYIQHCEFPDDSIAAFLMCYRGTFGPFLHKLNDLNLLKLEN